MSLFDALMACSAHHEHAALTLEGTLKTAPEGTAWKTRKRLRKHMSFAFACAKAAEVVAKNGGAK